MNGSAWPICPISLVTNSLPWWATIPTSGIDGGGCDGQFPPGPCRNKRKSHGSIPLPGSVVSVRVALRNDGRADQLRGADAIRVEVGVDERQCPAASAGLLCPHANERIDRGRRVGDRGAQIARTTFAKIDTVRGVAGADNVEDARRQAAAIFLADEQAVYNVVFGMCGGDLGIQIAVVGLTDRRPRI